MLYLVLFLFSNLTSLLGPLIFAKLLNEIQRNGVSADNITSLLLTISMIVGATILFWLFHGIGRVVERKNAFYAKVAYREYLLTGVLGMGLHWHGSRDSGSTIDKVNKAVDGLNHFSERIFLITEILVRILGTAAVLFFFNPYIGMFVVPFIVLTFITLFQFDKRLVQQYKTLNLLGNKVSAKIFDALSNITSIIILDVRDPIMRNIRNVMLQPRQMYGQNVVLNELKWFTGSMAFDTLLALPLGFYIFYVFRHNIPLQVGTISALYLYLSRLSEVFFTFGSFYEGVIIDKTSVQNAADIENAFGSTDIRRISVSKWNNLNLANVSFAYEDVEQEAQHLNNISLVIRRGERIAFMGESGSGKTTFLKVFHGLYRTARASVSFDGKRVRKTNFADIDLHTMLVPQEPELFSASIQENITFGVDFSLGEIVEAIDLAQFVDVLELLPQGLDSVVNEKGVNLSGGQKQRLALARALLFAKNKDILLLDESTSSVDPKNENLIYENILGNFKDKTILASIHKMNLLKYFDRIVIFDKGSKVDEGSFEELLGRNETFKQNWNNFIAASVSNN